MVMTRHTIVLSCEFSVQGCCIRLFIIIILFCDGRRRRVDKSCKIVNTHTFFEHCNWIPTILPVHSSPFWPGPECLLCLYLLASSLCLPSDQLVQILILFLITVLLFLPIEFPTKMTQNENL